MARYIEEIAPEIIRQNLTTEFGRQAFEQLNGLSPRWLGTTRIIEDRLYLSPSISVKNAFGSTGGVEEMISGGWAKTYDEAVIAQRDALNAKLNEKERRVVVIGNGQGLREFTYDKANDRFAIYKP